VSVLVNTPATVSERARWEVAYRDAFPRVYRGIVALGARPHEAEDALHDAFVKGLSASGVDNVEGWLFVVSLRNWRRRRIRERIFLPFARVTREPASEPDALGHVAFFAALRALPTRQRQIVVARYVVGLSQEETARALGIARGTVSATTSQAAVALRRAMKVEESR
jgi:RNA polymerase sigma-70 factor, ECF subfamily